MDRGNGTKTIYYKSLKSSIMNNSFFFGLLLLSFNYNCAEVNSQDMAQNTKAVDSVYVGPTHFSDDVVREDSLYTAIIRVDKQSDKEHLLSIQMNLKKNSYFVSPTEPPVLLQENLRLYLLNRNIYKPMEPSWKPLYQK